MEVSGAVPILQEGDETEKLLGQCTSGFGESRGSYPVLWQRDAFGKSFLSFQVFPCFVSSLLHLSLGGAVAQLPASWDQPGLR